MRKQSLDEECCGGTDDQGKTNDPSCDTPSGSAAAGSKHVCCFGLARRSVWHLIVDSPSPPIILVGVPLRREWTVLAHVI